ncbi:MAG: WxcM-like domain-containing protein [Prevotella sp.]|jgi:dTDP-4-dehydrorhamnose 3,5-epimerase-like enzyme|nr:WxcM-like domain-containing protein [Prevotella sp.]
MTNLDECKIVTLARIVDPTRGALTVTEQGRDVPFDIRRAYWIYDVPSGESRGGHAHKELRQLLVAISGSFKVVLDNGKERREIMLNHPWQGLLIVPGVWRTLEDFSSGAVCLCLASEHYDEEEYIRDYAEFKTLYSE